MRSLDNLDPSRTALVIIDLQHDYCAPDGLAARKLGWDVAPLDALCRKHEAFLKEARELLPARRIIWFRMEEDTKSHGLGPAIKADPKGIPPLAMRGTKGHEFHIVRPERGERTFTRTDPDIFSTKPFQSFLKHEGITYLVLTGAVFSHGVNPSIAGGSSLNHEMLLVDDLMANPGNMADEFEAHKKTASLYAPFVQSAELIGVLKSKKAAA